MYVCMYVCMYVPKLSKGTPAPAGFHPAPGKVGRLEHVPGWPDWGMSGADAEMMRSAELRSSEQ